MPRKIVAGGQHAGGVIAAKFAAERSGTTVDVTMGADGLPVTTVRAWGGAVRYRQADLISTGSEGRVYRGTRVSDGTPVAIKESVDRAHVRAIAWEAWLLASLPPHPNIVETRSFCPQAASSAAAATPPPHSHTATPATTSATSPTTTSSVAGGAGAGAGAGAGVGAGTPAAPAAPSPTHTWQSTMRFARLDCLAVPPHGRRAYLVLELAATDVFYAARDRSHALCEAEAVDSGLQIFRALAHLHAHLVCHRDVTSNNLLVAQDGSIKLSDFGAAGVGVRRVASPAGTHQYVPPEMVAMMQRPGSGRSAAVFPVDVFAAVRSWIEYCTQRQPWLIADTRRCKYYAAFVSTGERKFHAMPHGALAKDLVPVMCHGMRASPAGRPTAEQLVHTLEAWNTTASSDVAVDDAVVSVPHTATDGTYWATGTVVVVDTATAPPPPPPATVAPAPHAATAAGFIAPAAAAAAPATTTPTNSSMRAGTAPSQKQPHGAQLPATRDVSMGDVDTDDDDNDDDTADAAAELGYPCDEAADINELYG